MEINEIKRFIEKQSWIFAKTYANKAPHEYVVRGRINGTDEEFLSEVIGIFMKFVMKKDVLPLLTMIG